jgi:DNA-binding MarR family transcriptional regulator
MSPLDRKTAELRRLVEDMLYQFRKFDDKTANRPHVDLSCRELCLVEYLGDSGPHKMRDVADFLVLAGNTVTSTIDNLEAKGLVRRRRSEEDRRVVHVELTEAGLGVYRAALAEKTAVLRKMLEPLAEDERETFLALFRKIVRVGDALVSAQRGQATA